MEVRMEQALFENNTAREGGGLFNKRDRLHVLRTRFFGNTASQSGGACANRDARATMKSCIIDGNTARHGAAISSSGFPLYENCTIVHNEALISGGALHSTAGKPILRNSILWNNCVGDACDDGSQMEIVGGSILVRYCDVQNLHDTGLAEGNIVAEPGFLNDGDRRAASLTNAYQITPFSPCAEAGDPASDAVFGESDWGGENRMRGCRIDMGANESPAIKSPADFSGDDRVNLIDVLYFQTCFNSPTNQPDWASSCLCVFDADHSDQIDLHDWVLMKERLAGGH
jgi:hypothetical protein